MSPLVAIMPKQNHLLIPQKCGFHLIFSQVSSKWCHVGLIFPLGVPVGRHIDERCCCERREQQRCASAAAADPCRHGVCLKRSHNGLPRTQPCNGAKNPYFSCQNGLNWSFFEVNPSRIGSTVEGSDHQKGGPWGT